MTVLAFKRHPEPRGLVFDLDGPSWLDDPVKVAATTQQLRRDCGAHLKLARWSRSLARAALHGVWVVHLGIAREKRQALQIRRSTSRAPRRARRSAATTKATESDGGSDPDPPEPWNAPTKWWSAAFALSYFTGSRAAFYRAVARGVIETRRSGGGELVGRYRYSARDVRRLEAERELA